IHARDACGRKCFGDGTLDLLGAYPAKRDVAVVALGTLDRCSFFAETVMTNEPAPRAVVRERHVALLALPDMAAVSALHERGVTSAVQQEDDLLVLLKSVVDSVDQRFR